MADPIKPRGFIDGETKEALTPAQQSTYRQLQAAGGIDLNAAPGSPRLPRAQRPNSDTENLSPDTFTVDERGFVRQGAYGAAAGSVQPNMEALIVSGDKTAPSSGPDLTQDPEADFTKRFEAREEAVDDKEVEQIYAEADAWKAAGAAAADVGKGVFVEGAPAVVRGVKGAVNSTLDLVEEVADQLPTVTWSGFDGDASTPQKIEIMTGTEAKKKGLMERVLPTMFKSPEEGKPETVTGNIIEKGSQFAAGMVGGGKILKGWTAATKGGVVVKSMATGAIADFTAFDGNEERLSNMLAGMAPEAAKPVFEYLSAKDEDPELLGRAKNAIEGLGLGIVAEGVMTGIRGVRAARQAKQAMKEAAIKEGGQVPADIAAAELDAGAAKAAEEIDALLGKPKGPRFSAKVAAQNPTIKAGELPGTIEPNVFDINFARIETPDDVKAVISTIMQKEAGAVDDARRGVRTWEQTTEEAAGFDWVNSMAKRRAGDALNAEQIFAYRTALNASATKVLTLAREVQRTRSVQAQYAFRRGVATHQAIQMEFMGARAEAGRALNAFKIPADTPARAMRQIDALLADMGGSGTTDALAKKILEASAHGDHALNQVMMQGAMARSRDMIKLIYTNGLLSNAATPIVNMAGNSMAVGQNLLTRMVSPRLAALFGDVSETEIGEAAAIMHGMTQAFRDAFRLSGKETAAQITFDAAKAKGPFRALAPGLDGTLPDGLRGSVREESVSSRPLSAAAWRVEEDTVLGRTLDTLQMFFEAPSNLNALGDDFFKTIAARGELHAQAFRQMQREARAGLLETPQAMSARARELVDNPTQAMLDAAEMEMKELTFTRETPGVITKLNGLRADMDSAGPVPFGTVLMPFLKTPANIISTATRYSPLAPLSRRFREDMAAGGARAEIAKAKIAVGVATYGVFMDMAMNGDLTGGGPLNKAQREAMERADETGATGWQPYSVRITDADGNRVWVNYGRLDPLGTQMSIIGDMNEIMANDDWDGAKSQELDEVTANVIMATGQALFNKSMLKSTQDTITAFTGNSVEKADKAIKDRLTAFMPGSAALRGMRRMDDPYLRETASVVDAFKNSLPGSSDDLPAQRDLWGNPRTYQSGLGAVYDTLVPLKTRREGGSAIDAEILDNGVSVSMPARSFQIGDERVSLKNRPDIYTKMVELAGKPAFEHLNAVASGNHEDSDYYFSASDGPNGEKAGYIKSVIEAYRRDARMQVMDMYGDELLQMAAESKARREKARE